MNISFTDRLKCPHSYSTDDNKNLLCDYNIGDGICDGVLWEHCMWDKDYDDTYATNLLQEYFNSTITTDEFGYKHITKSI